VRDVFLNKGGNQGWIKKDDGVEKDESDGASPGAINVSFW
jgi:hypothetical protein